MKTNNKYNERLLKFAKHLEKIKTHPEMGIFETVELIALEEKVRIHYKVLYHGWVFGELPIIFDEWYFTEKYGNPMLERADEKEGTVAAVIDFFNLTLDEFSHLFDIEGFQHTDRFGGEKLTTESNGVAIAKNIYGLVMKKEPGMSGDEKFI